MTVNVTIDNRERGTYALEQALHHSGYTFNTAQLIVGDYLISDGISEIVVERKYGSDLYNSLFDGRLENQLSDLSSYTHNLLVFVGNPYEPSLVEHMPSNFKNAVPFSITNLLTSIAFRNVEGRAIHFLIVPDNAQFIAVIKYLCKALKKNYLDRKSVDPAINRIIKSHQKSNMTKAILVGMVGKIPKLGHQKADKLLKVFNYDLLALLTSSEEELRKIKGVGPKTVEWFVKLQKYFKGEYVL